MLKSLNDWEKSRRESGKQSKSSQSLVDVSERDSGHTSKEDEPGNFERAKAHKSTMEAAISEVVF